MVDVASTRMLLRRLLLLLFLVTLTGCGSMSDEPTLAPTPPGVTLLEPGPAPKTPDPLASRPRGSR